MARLRRRGMGKAKLAHALNREEYIEQSIEGLDLAYEQLWADAEKCIGDHENSWFWALMFRSSTFLLAPVVRDVTKTMDNCLASAIMLWNAGHISANEVGSHACAAFGKWFREEFLRAHDERCGELDKKLMEELDEYVCSAMEHDGVRPVHLHSFSTADFYNMLRAVMLDELLPTVEAKIAGYVPGEIRDTPISFIRRRRLRRAMDSFFALKREQGARRGDFVTDVLIGEKLELDHANAVLHALGRSIMAEKLALLGK